MKSRIESARLLITAGPAGRGLMPQRHRIIELALILSAVWCALVMAIGYTHTDVILAGKITDAEDAAISSVYGVVFGLE
jgi:hypothetical protein